MKLFTFKGGVHPPEHKVETADKKIETFRGGKEYSIPLLQHIGAPLDPIVAEGDRVLKGQKIAESKAFVSSPVHSPISGIVKNIEQRFFANGGKVNTIVLEDDGMDELFPLSGCEDWKNASKEELLEIIKEKGVVGIGGACFPTHIKLNVPADKKIDVLLINGAECEPYLNSDNRMMLEEPEKIIEGIEITLKILGVDKCYLGIEDNKPEALEVMTKASQGTKVEVSPLKTQYPQGGEKQLIKAVLNRDVPTGELPSAVGVVVQNTGTMKAIRDAVVDGMPIIEKVVTVSGGATKNPCNLRVSIGTSIKEILDYVGCDESKVEKLVTGGPMMGMAQHTADVSIIKGTSGILALTKDEVNPYPSRSCINCAKCIGACPMKLLPNMFGKLARYEQWEQMDDYNLMTCMECGSCSYICPSNRPLTEAIKIGKAKLRTIKAKEKG